MAVVVEMVVDRGVDGGELLQGLDVSEPRHRPFPPSKRLMPVFCPFVEPTTAGLGGRVADLYIFGWHPEAREEFADHRDPEQWVFIVVPTSRLPVGQKTIGLAPLRDLGESVRSDSLASAVGKMVDACSPDTVSGYENGAPTNHRP